MPPPSITPANQNSSRLAHLVPTPQPDINNRQASEPNDLITLSITRDTTTFTTVIILGGTAAPSTNNYQPAPATSIVSGSSLTTVALVSNGSTGMPRTTNYPSASSTTTVSGSSTTAAPVSNGSTGTPSSVIIGAVLGSIFGSILCLALIWLCCYSPYRPKFPLTGAFYDDDGTELGSWESESRKSSRRRRSSFRTGEVVVIPRPVSKKVSRGGRSSYQSSAGRGRVSAKSRSEVRIERIYERPEVASGRPLRDRDVRPLGRELASLDSF